MCIRQNISKKGLFFCLVTSLIIGFASSISLAEDIASKRLLKAEEPPTDLYNGTFIAIEGHTNLGLLEDRDGAYELGVGGEISGRVSILMHLFDALTGYRFTSYGFDSNGADIYLEQHSIFAAIRLHPMFMVLLSQNYFSHVLSSAYVDVGATLNITNWSTPQEEDSEWGLGVRVGMGLDLPIGMPKGDGSFWIGLGYERGFLNQLENRNAPFRDVNEHIFQARLSYRFHNLRFGHVPRPDEFGLNR